MPGTDRMRMPDPTGHSLRCTVGTRPRSGVRELVLRQHRNAQLADQFPKLLVVWAADGFDVGHGRAVLPAVLGWERLRPRPSGCGRGLRGAVSVLYFRFGRAPCDDAGRVPGWGGRRSRQCAGCHGRESGDVAEREMQCLVCVGHASGPGTVDASGPLRCTCADEQPSHRCPPVDPGVGADRDEQCGRGTGAGDCEAERPSSDRPRAATVEAWSR